MMKLLFDANLSHKLVTRLEDLFPDSLQVRNADLKGQEDLDIWTFAKRAGFVIVTLDSDFYDFICLYGPPPKVIWLRCGNQPTNVHEQILRTHIAAIKRFSDDPDIGCLELV